MAQKGRVSPSTSIPDRCQARAMRFGLISQSLDCQILTLYMSSKPMLRYGDGAMSGVGVFKNPLYQLNAILRVPVKLLFNDCLFLLPVIFLVFFVPSAATSGERISSAQRASPSHNPDLGPVLQDSRTSGPYCGIHSLFICLDALGIVTDLREYITQDYIGTFQGSTAEELIQAAEDFDARAACFAHLTHRELARINSPAILHMRSNWADGGFNHWVAFLGIEGGRVRIVDAPHPLQTMAIAELLANWDGTAIVVDREDPSTSFVTAARFDYFAGVAVVVLLVLLMRTGFSRNRPGKPSSLLQHGKLVLLQAGVLLGVALILGLMYHSCSTVGFLRNPSAVAEVTRRFYSIEIPELTMAETEEEIAQKKPVVLDARRVADYQHGSLPGAKNMSLYSTLPERQEILWGIAKSQRIIVYCQSSRCGYADEVAKFLKFNGYENLAIYRNGWREWKTKHPLQMARPSK